MKPPTPDETRTMQDQMSMLGWLGGIAATLITAAFAHVHMRINRGEDTHEEALKEVRQQIGDARDKAADDTLRGDKALWEQLALRERADREFRESVLTNMATKEDLRQLRTDLRDMLHDVPRASH